MDLNRLEELVLKYYKAEATLEQEKELRSLLQQQDLPEEYHSLREQMSIYSEEAKINFDVTRLTTKPWEGKINVGPDSGRVIRLRYALASAATIAAIFLLFWVNQPPVNDLVVEDKSTIDDPELAYQETRKALMLVSSKLSTGMTGMQEISRFNQTREQIKNKSK